MEERAQKEKSKQKGIIYNESIGGTAAKELKPTIVTLGGRNQ